MTAAIDDVVEEWQKCFKPSESKNINLEVIKLCKKTQLTSQKSDFLHYSVMEPRLGFAYQPITLEQEAIFHFHQCTILEAAPPRCYGQKK